MNSLAIAMGYGVGVGLEDNIWYDEEQTKLATNIDFLERIKMIANANGREICSSKEIRGKLMLQDGKGKYGTK